MHFFRSTRPFLGLMAVVLPLAGGVFRQQESRNAAADLAQRVQAEKVVLNYDEQHGYLRSVLKELKVPISSQTLVFSKSSFQLTQISPETPRAVYFNDDIYVGWVNHGQFIEIAALDPKNGP